MGPVDRNAPSKEPEPQPTESDRDRARAWLHRAFGSRTAAPADAARIESLAREFAAVRLEGAKAEARRLTALFDEPKTTPHHSGDPLVHVRRQRKP